MIASGAALADTTATVTVEAGIILPSGIVVSPGQTASFPVSCASAEAASAAASSLRTCTHSMSPLRRMASLNELRLSPTIP